MRWKQRSYSKKNRQFITKHQNHLEYGFCFLLVILEIYLSINSLENDSNMTIRSKEWMQKEKPVLLIIQPLHVGYNATKIVQQGKILSKLILGTEAWSIHFKTLWICVFKFSFFLRFSFLICYDKESHKYLKVKCLMQSLAFNQFIKFYLKTFFFL